MLYIQFFYRVMTTDAHPLKMTKFPGWDDTVATVSECSTTGAKVLFNLGTPFEIGQQLILLKPKEEDSTSGGKTQSTKSESEASLKSKYRLQFEDMYCNPGKRKLTEDSPYTLHTLIDCVVDKVLVNDEDIVEEGRDLFILGFKRKDFDGPEGEYFDSAEDNDDANKKEADVSDDDVQPKKKNRELDTEDISSSTVATQAADTNSSTLSLLPANFKPPNSNKYKPRSDPWEPITFKSFASMTIVEVMVKDGEEVEAYQPLIKYKLNMGKSGYGYEDIILDEETGYLL